MLWKVALGTDTTKQMTNK